jgi:hypothetical protein
MEKENSMSTNDKYSVKELMIMKSVEKIKDPFKNLTVEEVAKDLKMGENLTNQLFKREDFPSVNIGKTKTVTLLAYLLWKMEKRS